MNHQRERQHLTCANRIKNDYARAEFLAAMNEADRLHTQATELRKHAWAIYHGRFDQETFA